MDTNTSHSTSVTKVRRNIRLSTPRQHREWLSRLMRLHPTHDEISFQDMQYLLGLSNDDLSKRMTDLLERYDGFPTRVGPISYQVNFNQSIQELFGNFGYENIDPDVLSRSVDEENNIDGDRKVTAVILENSNIVSTEEGARYVLGEAGLEKGTLWELVGLTPAIVKDDRIRSIVATGTRIRGSGTETGYGAPVLIFQHGAKPKLDVAWLYKDEKDTFISLKNIAILGIKSRRPLRVAAE